MSFNQVRVESAMIVMNGSKCESWVAYHMMESSALRTMYLTPENGMSSETQRCQLSVTAPAICKFLPMIEAGLPAAAQIWKVE